jgi:hypothetical protein
MLYSLKHPFNDETTLLKFDMDAGKMTKTSFQLPKSFEVKKVIASNGSLTIGIFAETSKQHVFHRIPLE